MILSCLHANSERQINAARKLRAAKLAVFIVLLSTALLKAAMAAENPFRVENVLSARSDEEITVFSQLNLSLSQELIDAINHGVPIHIVIDYGKPVKRIFGDTHQVLTSIAYRIERHSLSNRYVLNDTSSNELNIFTSIGAALGYLGQSVALPIAYDANMKTIAVRSYIDIYRLPPPLRFKAFFSRNWKHDSDWSIWPLHH